ncbi:MAG: hypothetical protein FWH44_05900 [Methanomassiliicoccaceae archaeon]|nr:hypothetical protein [Methanomassiliicoccaceae archaeon]
MLSTVSVIKRKSVRKYDMTPLQDETLNELNEFVGALEPPFAGKFGYKIFSKKEYDVRSGGAFGISAPHYLMFFGDKNDDNVLRNIGYAGELAALKLADMGIGTCWLGGPKSKETLDSSEYVICICFGTPVGELRGSENEAERKKLDEIASNYNDEQKEMLRYVRLAPSARNLQPWFFRCGSDRIHVFKVKTGGLMSKLALFKVLQKIDIGIAISHFSFVKFTIENDPQDDKGMQYECTLKF